MDNYNFTDNPLSNEPPASLPPSFTQISPLSFSCVLAYSLLMIVSACGNISVFFSVFRSLNKGRISILLLHLCIADLIVTFTAMPMEIGWRITIAWEGGEFLCKFLQFLRAFGLYLSSMVVICITLDRYFAIIHPLKLGRALERAKLTLLIAWLTALSAATPQTVIFKVEPHPLYPEFRQCVTETFLNDGEEEKRKEMAYNIFSVMVLYFVPLGVIVYTYGRILVKIYRKSRRNNGINSGVRRLIANGVLAGAGAGGGDDREFDERMGMGRTTISYFPHDKGDTHTQSHLRRALRPSLGDADLTRDEQGEVEIILRNDEEESEPPSPNNLQRRQDDLREGDLRGSSSSSSRRKLFLRTSISGGVLMARAKSKTLRLTCVIIFSFVFCWTPYVVMTLWYMFDREGARSVDTRVQEGLFLMAVANSVVNPLIYGTYGNSDCRRSRLPVTKKRLQGHGHCHGHGHGPLSSQQRRSLNTVTAASVVLTQHYTATNSNRHPSIV